MATDTEAPISPARPDPEDQTTILTTTQETQGDSRQTQDIDEKPRPSTRSNNTTAPPTLRTEDASEADWHVLKPSRSSRSNQRLIVQLPENWLDDTHEVRFTLRRRRKPKHHHTDGQRRSSRYITEGRHSCHTGSRLGDRSFLLSQSRQDQREEETGRSWLSATSKVTGTLAAAGLLAAGAWAYSNNTSGVADAVDAYASQSGDLSRQGFEYAKEGLSGVTGTVGSYLSKASEMWGGTNTGK